MRDRSKEIAMLEDTLKILKQGWYEKNGKRIQLKLSAKEMQEIQVYLPEAMKKNCSDPEFSRPFVIGRCGHGCENIDSFALARKRLGDTYLFTRDDHGILVLNLANPVHPGGGVRNGARAQEEDLCRKSSLLLSLESKEARKYYDYNKSLNTYLGSDALMIAPYVEIIKDANGDLLDDTVVVSVLFYKALKEMNYNKLREKDLFRRIDFAVLDRTQDQYNFKEFYRNFAFDNFYRDEDQQEMDEAMKRIREKEINLDKILGSLAGGAVGDALGYAVEFWGEEQIFGKYGERGITEYELDSFTGKALISDDTQMTLFTANGLLVGDTRGAMRGIQGWPRHYVTQAYQDWLYTQECPFDKQKIQDRKGNYSCRSWLADVPELYSSRAPGNTCLSALSAQKNGKDFVNDYVKEPQNQSKGCGGIMRVAPVALNYKHMEMGTLDMEGAQIAAITHGHSLGYMPAAIVTHIINCIVFGEEKKTLKNIVIEARDKVAEIFRGDRHLKELTDIIDLAIELSGNEADDLDNIHMLGEGWVAEETLGIALYCALRHQDDFSAGVISAVNHKGDSDSTGAVTGNILGALLGYDAIEEKWKTNLELIDVIIEMADDLCHGCQMSEFGHYEDPDWIRKYICMQWKDERLDPAKTDKV